MDLKLNNRLPQTADRKDAFQNGVETELRRRLQLMGSYGIVSTSGDVDNESSACAVIVNATDPTAIDVLAGTVVFPNGEFCDVYPNSITAFKIDTSITDAQVLRLEYGEIEDGTIEANPYYNFAAKPKVRKKTPLEMLVLETIVEYNAQPQDVLSKSVVIGVVRYLNSALVVDNGRDTYSFSRPWSSPVDLQHRSFVGSGVQTPSNPHGMSANDLTVGSYTMWQALAGPPSSIIARPVSYGRIPGSVCTETIPAGSFIIDTTGRVTGCPNAHYAYLGFWPERLTSAVFSSSPTTEVAAWIPRGRNVLAIFDPLNMPPGSPQNVDVTYTRVEAGSLPASLIGLTTLEMGQPTENELLVAGGSIITELSDPSVTFTDVGMIPTYFDIMVGKDGKVYKRPDCIYCNTKLDTVGSAPVTFSIQPRVPTKLRVAISNYVAAMTEVRFRITGLDENNAVVSETVSFTGPMPAVGPGVTELAKQRVFTNNLFSSVTQFQVLVRNGDGPNTTVTVFAEYVPERPGVADDLLLASVIWTGTDVSANYHGTALSHHNSAIDRRSVSRGGQNRGLSPVSSFLMSGAMQEGIGSTAFSNLNWVTIVEDFGDPQWQRAPQILQPDTIDSELFSNSVGARSLYTSRMIPFANQIAINNGDPSKVILRLLPRSLHDWPNYAKDLVFTVYLYNIVGPSATTTRVLTSNMSSTGISMPYPPFQPGLTISAPFSGSYYAARVAVTSSGGPVQELIQGFMLQIRQ